MASLIVSHDSRLMMLEVAVRNLYMPWTDVVDQALLKKTVIMFRMLDADWTSLLPNRRDYRNYRGSSYENESFYGGKSVVFSMPTIALQKKVEGVDVQLHVYKEVSKHFERASRQNYGFALVGVDDLLNGIIKDLEERKELAGCISSCLQRQPVSRSSSGVYQLLDEDLKESNATIELYIRLTYLGESIVTEIDRPQSVRKAFYSREESDNIFRYQMRELSQDDVEFGTWGSTTILPPKKPGDLVCRCKKAKADVLVAKAECERHEATKESELKSAQADAACARAAALTACAAVAAAAESAAAREAARKAEESRIAAAEAAAVEAAAAEAARAQAAAAKAAKAKAKRAKAAAAKARAAEAAAADAAAAEAAAEAAAARAAAMAAKEEFDPPKLSSREQFEADLARMQELIAMLRGRKKGGTGAMPISERRGGVCTPMPCYNPCYSPGPMSCGPPLGLVFGCPM